MHNFMFLSTLWFSTTMGDNGHFFPYIRRISVYFHKFSKDWTNSPILGEYVSTLFSTYSPILGEKVSTFKVDTYSPNMGE